MDRGTGRCFVIVMFIVLLSHAVKGMNGVWRTTTSFDGEKSQAILFWGLSTTEDVISFTIKHGKEDFVASLIAVTVTSSNKYQVLKTQTTREIMMTLTVHNITTRDSGIYRCSVDQLEVHSDIHLNITDLMPTSNPVTSTLHQDAKLVWEYTNQRYPANKLIVSRESKKIAEWTSNGGFSHEEDRFRWNPIFEKTTIKDGEIDVITLILRDTNIDDFNKTYYCNLFSADQNILTSEINLVIELPVWIDPISIVKAGLGEDVIFTWQYKYRFKPSIIIVRQRHETSARMSEPIGNFQDTELFIFPKYKSLARMNKTSTEEGEIIQLILLKTTKELLDSIFERRFGQPVQNGPAA